MTQSRGPEPACPATTAASRLKTLGRKVEFCLDSSLPPTCHLINLGCCYIPHFLRGRYICLLCLNIHLKCISLCKCPLIYIILYKCTNPVIICGFLNALFSFMLGSVSLSPSFPLLHPAFTSDNSCNSCGCILPNFPPFHPTLHRMHMTHTHVGHQCSLYKMASYNNMLPHILLFSLNNSSWEWLQVFWYIFNSLFLMAEK